MSFENVNRFEVIDHRGHGADAFLTARAFQAHGVKVMVSLQDDGRTLKVFVSDPGVSSG